MDADFVERWRLHGLALWVASQPAVHDADRRERDRPFLRAFDRFMVEAPIAEQAWTPAMQLAFVSRFSRAFGNPFEACLAKCLRAGFVLASGDYGMLAPADYLHVQSTIVLPPPCEREPPGSPPPPGAAFVAPFRFTYSARLGRKRLPVLAHGAVAVRRVRTSETTRVMSLPHGGGGALSVVSLDGALYREVAAPGSWDRLDEAEFIAACRGDDVWRDDPFGDAWHGTMLSPRERAVPAPFAPSPDEEAEFGRALEDRLARAGDFVSVDGIVHRRVPEPTLHLAHRFEGGDRVSIEWRSANLHARCPVHGFGSPYAGGDWTCNLRALDGFDPPDFLSFPLSASAVASDFGRVVARVCDGTFSDAYAPVLEYHLPATVPDLLSRFAPVAAALDLERLADADADENLNAVERGVALAVAECAATAANMGYPDRYDDDAEADALAP